MRFYFCVATEATRLLGDLCSYHNTLGGEAKGCSRLPSVSKASNQPQLRAKETNRLQIHHKLPGKLCSGELSLERMEEKVERRRLQVGLSVGWALCGCGSMRGKSRHLPGSYPPSVKATGRGPDRARVAV